MSEQSIYRFKVTASVVVFHDIEADSIEEARAKSAKIDGSDVWPPDSVDIDEVEFWEEIMPEAEQLRLQRQREILAKAEAK